MDAFFRQLRMSPLGAVLAEGARLLADSFDKPENFCPQCGQPVVKENKE